MVLAARIFAVLFALAVLGANVDNPQGNLIALVLMALLFIFAPRIFKKKPRKSKTETNKSVHASAKFESAPAAPAPAPAVKVEKFNVAGLFYHMNEFMELAENNPFYSTKKADLIEDFLEDEYVFKYDFSPALVELIPEPDNEHDPNAVAVHADKHMIGYIKAGNCSHVKKLLAAGTIQKIDLDVWGGPYVYLDTDENRLEKGERDYKVKVIVTIAE